MSLIFIELSVKIGFEDPVKFLNIVTIFQKKQHEQKHQGFHLQGTFRGN